MVGVIDVVVVEGALDTVDESGDAAETRFFVSSSRNMDSMSRAWRVRLETARWRASAVLKVARELLSFLARDSIWSMPTSTASRTWSSTRIAMPDASTWSDVKNADGAQVSAIRGRGTVGAGTDALRRGHRGARRRGGGSRARGDAIR